MKKQIRFIIFALANTALLVVIFFWLQAPPEISVVQDANVLLITIDTLRADHLPFYGYKKGETPNLATFAKQSFIFDAAYAHVPLTLPSHVSILTGLLPLTHGVRDNGGYFLDQEITSLPEVFQQSGYATAAFLSAYVLDRQFRLDQGFDEYRDQYEGVERKGEFTAAEFEQWLSANGQKQFFAWIHLYDPHDPYEPPEAYASRFPSSLYDGEIAYTDEIVGRILRTLEESKRDKNTIVILTGDHGESLGEHGEVTHGVFIYNSTMHVPLLIRVPHATGGRISDTVSHIDLAPTVLEIAGLSRIPEMQGRSLVPLMKGKKEKDRPVYAESLYSEIHYGWSPLQSIIREGKKYIEAPRSELYELQDDPEEKTNRIAEKASIAKVLKSELREMIREHTRGDRAVSTTIDAETEEKLRALGYISMSPAKDASEKPADPKDKIHLHRAFSEVYSALKKNENDAVIRLLSTVLQEDPNMIEARFIAGMAYEKMGDYEKAIHELLQVVAKKSDHPKAIYTLAYCYQMTRKYNEAVHWYDKLLEHDEDHAAANRRIAQLYFIMNESEKAAPYYSKATQLLNQSLNRAGSAEDRAKIYTDLAELHFYARNIQDAEKVLVAGLKEKPDSSLFHYNLAQIHESRNDLLSAAQEYRKAVELDPKNQMAFYNLGLIYRRVNQLQDAEVCFEEVLQINPRDLQSSYLLAETYYLQNKNLDEALRLAESVVQQKSDFQPAIALLDSIRTKVAGHRQRPG